MTPFKLPWRRACACVALTLGLGACALFVPKTPQPLLRLTPASLGASLALEQRLDVEVGGVSRQVDAVLEVDSESVRLAVLALGQTMARLDWDGTTLVERHAPSWPAIVSGERILSDLQLMLWPASAIRAVLPPDWTLQDAPGQRLLSAGAELVARVDYRSPSLSEMENLRGHYRLRVTSHPMEAQLP